MIKNTLGKRQAIIGYLFILPFVLFMLVTNIGPLIYSFIESFFQWSLSGPGRFVGFDIYRNVFADKIFWLSLKNTGLFFIICVPVEIIISLFLSVLFSFSINQRFKTFFKSIYFIPVITSFIAAAFIWKWIYNPNFGPIDQFLVKIGLPKILFLASKTMVIPSISIVNIWMRIGFIMMIFLAGLEGIPQNYYEAAMIDGASKWKIFSKITLPLLNPQLVIVIIFESINIIKIFDVPFVLTSGGPANTSRSIVLHIYETSFGLGKISEGLAMSVILFVIVMIISIFQWKVVRRNIDY